MRSSQNKEFRHLVDRLVREGWQFSHGRKHDKVKSPEGHLVVLSRSPSDWRTLRNLEARIRRLQRVA